MDRSSRAQLFGAVADLYHRVRPGYPDESIRAIIDFAELQSGDRALEIGAGTGKGTEPFAARGLHVTALEPDGAMAAVARRVFAAVPGVHIVEVRFEDYEGEDAAFDLVYSAQAWHWIDKGLGFEKAARLLRPGGTLALLWNVAHHEDSDGFHRLEEVYSRLAPEILGASSRIRYGDLQDQVAEISGSGWFRDVDTREWRWQRTMAAAEYTDLLQTHSDHRALDRETRRRLLGEVREILIDGGGEIVIPYSTELYLARRSSPA